MRYTSLLISFTLLSLTTPTCAMPVLITDALPGQNATQSQPKALVASRVNGIVHSPVSWSSGSGKQEKFRVKLTEPLLASDGSIILPKDTLLLAEITHTNWEFINAQITAVLIRDTDTPIPSNTLILKGESGNPLQAMLKKPSNPSDRISRSVGSGIVSGLSNTVRRSLPFGASRTFTNPVLNEGTSSIQRAINSPNSQQGSFFSLKENTPVVVFVNLPFSLP